MCAVSVIIPVFNEEDAILSVLLELDDVLKRDFLEYEILLVDDGSFDGTLSLVRGLENELPYLRIISLDKNKGQSWALLAGIKEAKYGVCVIMDGDGQYFPDDIKKICSTLEGNIRLVSGKRDNRKDSFLYRTASLVGNRLISILFETKQFDLGCGLKVGYREDLLRLPYFKHIHRYFQIIYIQSGLAVSDMDIGHRERRLGRSKYTLMKIFNILPRLLWLKINPLTLENKSERAD